MEHRIGHDSFLPNFYIRIIHNHFLTLFNTIIIIIIIIIGGAVLSPSISVQVPRYLFWWGGT
jgi:hypothetical protein